MNKLEKGLMFMAGLVVGWLAFLAWAFKLADLLNNL